MNLTDQLMLVAAGVVAVATFLCDRVLRHLHRGCPVVEPGTACDRGLLRWYVHGFDGPMKMAQALVMTSMALLITSLAIHASPFLVIGFVTLTGFSYMEAHYAAAHQRQLRLAMSRARTPG